MFRSEDLARGAIFRRAGMGADVGSERRGMRYIIVTGMSGAGKTSAIHALEDLGYFCVDNLPPSLIPRFIELWKSDPNTEENAAFGVDIRSRQYFNQLALVLQDMREKGFRSRCSFWIAETRNCPDDIRRHEGSIRCRRRTGVSADWNRRCPSNGNIWRPCGSGRTI